MNIAGVFVSEAVEVVHDVDFIEAMFLVRLMQSLWPPDIPASIGTKNPLIEAMENYLMMYIRSECESQ